jgi:hypothetical protein
MVHIVTAGFDRINIIEIRCVVLEMKYVNEHTYLELRNSNNVFILCIRFKAQRIAQCSIFLQSLLRLNRRS